MVDLRVDTRGNEPVDTRVDDKHVRAVASRLAEEFGRDADDLEVQVRSEFSRLGSARVTQFVPVFVERRMRSELRGTLPR
jgi:hypothetical protein